MPNLKHDITQYLIAELNDADLASTSSTWWYNIRANGGLRLTEQGNQILSEKLRREHWQWVYTNKNTVDKNNLLKLDRLVAFPYFIDKRNRKITFYSSQEAMMLNLYGDLTAWLASLQNTK